MATGFNFRATSGYVTDGAGETYVLAETYPTTRGGSTFGWTASGAAGRDRNAGVDRRVAGINFVSTAITSRTFRIDLPSAGTYEFRCAQGDYSFPQNGTLVVTDGTNTLLSLPSNGTTSGQFRDAANNKYSAAGWPGSNAAVELVFPGTLCHIVLSTAGNDAALAHVSLVQVGGSVGSPWNYYAQQ